jgi:AcrR family transcriptional regulator
MTAILGPATQAPVDEANTPALIGGRERVLQAAYALFVRHGIRAVGIETVVEAARVAKMTLYRHFPSKDALILAYLQRRAQLWIDQWLRGEVMRRGVTPVERLLAVFDAFDEWFASTDFEGCPFLTTMLEVSDRQHPVRQASVAHLTSIRCFVRNLAKAAGIDNPDHFSHQWHLLMKGAILAAQEGDTQAAQHARQLGVLLLRHHRINPGSIA